MPGRRPSQTLSTPLRAIPALWSSIVHRTSSKVSWKGGVGFGRFPTLCGWRRVTVRVNTLVPPTILTILETYEGFGTPTTLHFFNLVCSLPLLEDLAVEGHRISYNDDDNTVFQSLTLTSPPLTGSLELCLTRGMKPVTNLLLRLPNGVRFRKLSFTRYLPHDIWCTMELVEACSDTLERIDIKCRNSGEAHPSLFPTDQQPVYLCQSVCRRLQLISLMQQGSKKSRSTSKNLKKYRLHWHSRPSHPDIRTSVRSQSTYLTIPLVNSYK